MMIKAFKPRDCERLRILLDDFLCGELSVESNQEILQHLEACSACRLEKEARERQRQTLQESWSRQAVPSGLERAIRLAVDGKVRRLSGLLGWAAAFAIVGFSLPLLLHFFSFERGTPSAEPSSVVDHYDSVIRDHFQCGNPVPARAEECPLKEYRPQLEAALQRQTGDYRLRMFSRCRFEDTSVLHYLYERDGQRLSLILEPRTARQLLPQLAGEVQRVVDGVKIHSLVTDSVSLASFESPDYFVYLIVQRQSPQRTLLLAEQLLPSFRKALFNPG